MPILKSLRRSDALLLDSHVVLWLFEDSPQLDMRISDAIEECRGESKLHISAISFWELDRLCRKGRIHIGMNYGDWVRKISHQVGVNIVPLTLPVLMNAREIEGLGHHADPIDLMIVACALEHDAVLLTRDGALLEGAKNGRYRAFEV